MSIKTKAFDESRISELVQEWLHALNRLMNEVSGWIQGLPGWSSKASAKEVSEEILGTYLAPVLTIDTPEGRIILEPMARLMFGGRGTVEMYAWPTLYRARLIRRVEVEDWAILTDSGIKLKQPWNRVPIRLRPDSLCPASSSCGFRDR